MTAADRFEEIWGGTGVVAAVTSGAYMIGPRANRGACLQLVVAPTSTLALTFAGGAREVTDVTFIADTGALEVQVITWTNFAGGAQGDYIVVENAAGTKWAFWIDKNNAGTAPTGAAYVAVGAGNRVRINTTTGDTAAAIGAIFTTAAAALANVTVLDNADGTVRLTQTKMGNTTAPDPHNTGDTGVGSILHSTTTPGVASNLTSTYFVLYGATAGGGAETGIYYYFNINSEGVDPAPAGFTLGSAIVAVVAASAATVATAANTAIDAHALFASTRTSAVVTVTNTDRGGVTDASVGTVPAAFSRSVTTQGINPGATLATDVITISAHALSTGQRVAATSSSTLPAGLSATNYFAIYVSASTFKLATSYANALAGTAVDITDYGTEAATHTLTPATISHTVKLQLSNDAANWIDLASSSQNITDSTGVYWALVDVNYVYIRSVLTATSGVGAATYSLRVAKHAGQL